MQRRDYQNDPLWEDPTYRGKACPAYEEANIKIAEFTKPLYPEHDTAYLEDCIDNLFAKGILL